MVGDAHVVDMLKNGGGCKVNGLCARGGRAARLRAFDAAKFAAANK
jgi:hypothetical protein